jgi:flagellar motility protein MotE (MotC chaperone)
VVASLEASLKEKDEKLAGLEKNFATLQKRAKSRIQQLTQEKEAAEQQVGSGCKTWISCGSDAFGEKLVFW